MEKSLSLPFSIDSYGNIATTSDYTQIWSDRVRAVLGTSILERIMLPKFGTHIASAVYQNQEDAAQLISTEVTKAFGVQLPLLKLQSTNVSNDAETGVITVSITYALPNLKEVETQLSIAYVNGTTPIYEENL